ncbi:hypothetical protein FGIG_08271 [Fasciola gigantica]|uniref:Uncharacterized protein n=1 Tax=Fasciola gigantica TaxID=46835 RepID=A0A504YFR1_FASGI|nr:hypothetical protein FGIG_08271 [Fasciola gigantica]
MRQYNERWIMRDPILHRYGDENGQPVQRLNEMRHFAQQRAGNSWFSSSAKNLSSNDGSMRRPYVQRNPITGEGMRPEDYNDLQRVPSEYHFRQNPTVAHHVPSPRPMMSKSISATMAQPSRPTRSAVSPPRSFMRATKSPMKSMDSATIKEAPVVKKVVRPKRSSTVERARLAEDVASKDRVEPNVTERTNGRKLSSPRVSVRESSARASESKVMSFFEEAQMANENTWNETKETSEHTGTISEPRESVDYAESAQSLENEVTEENLHKYSPSEELDQENQCTETQSKRPVEPTEPSESHTPNLDLAASGNLFEELQVHDEQHSVEDDVLEAKHNGNLLGTTAPLFVSTGEEEGDEPHVYAYPADNEETDHVRDVQQHSGRHTEASVASDKEDDYIGAFLKTQTKISLPLDNTHETALSNYAVHTETPVNLEKPDDIQSPLNSEDLGSPNDSSIVY